MKLIVALGNPDPKYTHTRHNVGRAALEQFLHRPATSLWHAIKHNLTNATPPRVNVPGFAGKAYKLSGDIVAPDLGCYMNQSGVPVKHLLSYLKIDPTNLIVVHDEIDLPLKTIRVSTNSSAGGHNGIKSIIQEIGTTNFTRVRIGIENREVLRQPPTDHYVLQKFDSTEHEALKNIYNDTLLAIDNLLK